MKIRVGILTAPKIEFERREKTFLLKNVRIGIGFHWDRYEDQEFAGELEIRRPAPNPFLKDGETWETAKGEPWETAINTIELEDYLCSVISSEMSANSPMELLKAHAVISRSWAIRQMVNKPHAQMVNGQMVNDFDVCADDHCQRYEGLRRMNERAVEAVRATEGQVLTNEQMVNGKMVNEICDCRYHKCCGGKTEIWRTCWEDIDVPYIRSVQCDWCKSPSPEVLRLVLNDYDQETKDFRDWQVTYTEDELDEIVRTKSGIDFGHITALEPLHRGPSGRIDSLRIVGTKHTEVIGKELKIRLWLSRSCLYSSWFDIKKTTPAPSEGEELCSIGLPVAVRRTNPEGVSSWVLTGHGWGHGAGLCQIGAAVMASEGKSYEEILQYYYAGARLSVATR